MPGSARTNRLGNVMAAELVKLCTLPAAALTAIGTVLVSAALMAASAAAAADEGLTVSATDVTLNLVPLVQSGAVLLGILSVSHEYAGTQHRTTLLAVPGRGLLLAGKTVAAAIALALVAVATVSVGAAAAAIVQRLLDAPAGTLEPWRLAGAACYLTLIGMLSYAAALLVRHLIPALVGMLSLVLLLPPLVAALTEHARWLPGLAGMQLYDSTDAVLTAGTGTLVLTAWILLVGAVAATRFVRTDA